MGTYLSETLILYPVVLLFISYLECVFPLINFFLISIFYD
jgi:hypothetical protein